MCTWVETKDYPYAYALNVQKEREIIAMHGKHGHSSNGQIQYSTLSYLLLVAFLQSCMSASPY